MWHRALAVVATLLALVPQTAAAGTGSAVLEQAYGRNSSLRSYTFAVDVEMSMHHFPWLHFRMEGTGVYERGTTYAMHFDKMPWFAPQHHDIDLSMLDPLMWPLRYTVEVAGTRGDDTLFELHELAGNDVKEASVAINPALGTQWVALAYTDGTRIEMNVTPRSSGGFLVPAQVSAEIDYPHMPLSAQASFSDYAFGSELPADPARSPAPSGQAIRTPVRNGCACTLLPLGIPTS